LRGKQYIEDFAPHQAWRPQAHQVRPGSVVDLRAAEVATKDLCVDADTPNRLSESINRRKIRIGFFVQELPLKSL
jgi:hypothetical protein